MIGINNKPKKSYNDLMALLPNLFEQVSFEEYWAHVFMQYPTLYFDKSKKRSQFFLLDHILNVNGNGLQSDPDLLAHFVTSFTNILSKSASERKAVIDNVYKLMEMEKPYYMEGYTQESVDLHVEEMKQLYGENSKSFELYESSTPYGQPTARLSLFEYLDLKTKYENNPLENSMFGELNWFEIELNERDYDEDLEDNSKTLSEQKALFEKIQPYPNFSSEYSVLYRAPNVSAVMLGSDDWRKAVIFFYDTCLQYFESGANGYSYAYKPGAFRAKELEESIIARSKQHKSFDEMSKEYGIEWKGPEFVQEFLTLRWNKNLDKLKLFVKNTLQLIETKKFNVTA